MRPKENQSGVTVMEGLIVIGLMALVVSIADAMVSKYTVSRSFDDTMKSMSSTLQMVKMKAARHGVEHRTVCY